MSSFLILSSEADGVGLALRLKQEGHDAPIWIRKKEYKTSGEGLIECVDKHIPGQLIIADQTGFGFILDKLRDEGVRIFAGGVFADRLEGDRHFAEKIMKDAGIDVPDSKSVTSWEDAAKQAEKFAKKSGKVVLKPEGVHSGVIPSYVASDAEDALSMLRQFEKKIGSSQVELTIQEFIDGVAVSTEGWFNGSEWAEGMFNHTIERKQFLDGDLGPSTGCAGNVMWPVGFDEPLVKQLLLKLTEVLRNHKYVGPIDVNAVVNEEGVYGLEFTPRFGYDAFPTALHSLCDFDFGNFISTMGRGDLPDVALSKGFGAGVRLTIPPYPVNDSDGEPIELRGFDDDAREYFYPYGVMLDGDTLMSAPGDGILGVMNYEGVSIGQATACVYHQIQKLKIPNLQYRTDLTEQFLKDYRELESILTGEEPAWIGVDLDGTLAEYSGWRNEIGKPIPKMVQRVKRWIAEGKEVRIFTARGSIDGEGAGAKYAQLMQIYDWIEDNIGAPLEVTAKKDPGMIRLYDDRVRQVEEGTGELVAS